jgi:hypothetical protein
LEFESFHLIQWITKMIRVQTTNLNIRDVTVSKWLPFEALYG